MILPSRGGDSTDTNISTLADQLVTSNHSDPRPHIFILRSRTCVDGYLQVWFPCRWDFHVGTCWAMEPDIN